MSKKKIIEEEDFDKYSEVEFLPSYPVDVVSMSPRDRNLEVEESEREWTEALKDISDSYGLDLGTVTFKDISKLSTTLTPQDELKYSIANSKLIKASHAVIIAKAIYALNKNIDSLLNYMISLSDNLISSKELIESVNLQEKLEKSLENATKMLEKYGIQDEERKMDTLKGNDFKREVLHPILQKNLLRELNSRATNKETEIKLQDSLK